MYTPNSRELILGQIVNIAKGLKYVEGIVLVGSRAKGFTDNYSDIDLSIAIKPSTKTKSTWNTINKAVIDKLNVAFHSLNEYGENDYLTLFFLDDFLQVDAGVISIDNLIAKKQPWKIMYDKRGAVTNKMQTTWANKKDQQIDKIIDSSKGNIYYNTQNVIFALNRSKPLRANKEIDDIREKILYLYGHFTNKEVKHYRDVDEMDVTFKDKLIETYPINFTSQELIRAFRMCFDLFFEVLKAVNGLSSFKKDEMYLRKFITEILD